MFTVASCVEGCGILCTPNTGIYVLLRSSGSPFIIVFGISLLNVHPVARVASCFRYKTNCWTDMSHRTGTMASSLTRVVINRTTRDEEVIYYILSRNDEKIKNVITEIMNNQNRDLC